MDKLVEFSLICPCKLSGLLAAPILLIRNSNMDYASGFVKASTSCLEEDYYHRKWWGNQCHHTHYEAWVCSNPISHVELIQGLRDRWNLCLRHNFLKVVTLFFILKVETLLNQVTRFVIELKNNPCTFLSSLVAIVVLVDIALRFLLACCSWKYSLLME